MSEERRLRISGATLKALNEGLTAAFNALHPIAQDEQSEGRKGTASKAIQRVEQAQRRLAMDMRS